MDVSIRSADKQTREAVIKARDEKQAAQALRKEKREAGRKRKVDAIVTKRLRRRIEKEVRADLLTEKKCYLAGEARGGEYVIDTRVRYKKKNWRLQQSRVEGLLMAALAKHSGFEHKIDFGSDYYAKDEWCDHIRIWYTLLEH